MKDQDILRDVEAVVTPWSLLESLCESLVVKPQTASPVNVPILAQL